MIGDKLVKIMSEAAKIPMATATEMLFGQVTSISPLKIKVDNRFEITDSFIILTSLVSDFTVKLTENLGTEDEETKEIKLGFSLKVGETVILLRVQNGQKFIVIDRVR